MYLRDRLTHYLRRAHVRQQEVADRWLEHATGVALPSRTTVLSQLSRLLRREETGATRFFFRTREFAGALFDSLEVPDWEREDLLEAAEVITRPRRRRT